VAAATTIVSDEDIFRLDFDALEDDFVSEFPHPARERPRAHRRRVILGRRLGLTRTKIGKGPVALRPLHRS